MAPGRRRANGEEFFAKWTREGDVGRAARAGGFSAVAVWSAIRAEAGPRAILEGEHSPSVPTLAATICMGVRTFERHLAKLERAGVVLVIRPPGRKPTWIVNPGEVDLRQFDGGSPQELQETSASSADVSRRFGAPAPSHRGEIDREAREGAARESREALAGFVNAQRQRLGPSTSPYYLEARRKTLDKQRREMLAKIEPGGRR